MKCKRKHRTPEDAQAHLEKHHTGQGQIRMCECGRGLVVEAGADRGKDGVNGNK